jgi:hypothetical protein
MTVFSGALERSDPSARAAYLDIACRGNLELRRLVDELLAAHDGAGRFLAEQIRLPLFAADQTLTRRASFDVASYYDAKRRSRWAPVSRTLPSA